VQVDLFFYNELFPSVVTATLAINSPPVCTALHSQNDRFLGANPDFSHDTVDLQAFNRHEPPREAMF
jgi:hypothetical protein